MRTISVQGNAYMAVYVDGWSSWTYVTCLKAKSEQPTKFKDYEAIMKRQFNVDIKVLRSDGGGEYSSAEFQRYLKGQGIMLQHSAPHTPQQNGKAERANRTIIEMARCLLLEAGLPHRYWEFAVIMAAYIRNRTPTRANKDQRSPFEVLYGKKPDLKEMPKFGSRCMVHVAGDKRGKLDAKARPCIFLGFADGAKASVFEDTGTGRRFVSRDAVSTDGATHEPEVGGWGESDESEDEFVVTESDEHSDGHITGHGHLVNQTAGPPDIGGHIEPSSSSATAGGLSNTTSVETIGVRRSGRSRRAPNYYHHEYVAATTETSQPEPVTAGEALLDEDWRASMDEEFNSLKKNGTWDLVPLPPGRRAVSGKWCYKAKTDANGTVVRRKSRYVARGFTQQPGVDFDETFSPVVSLTSLRILLAIATHLDMEVKQMDVDSAYLYGKLEEELFLEQPEGFVEVGPRGERLVCKLNKAIYGLKQAGRVWWRLIHDDLCKDGFVATTGDQCVYVRTEKGELTMLALYVDDLVVASTSGESINRLEAYLRSKYSMKPIGDINYVLGLAVDRDRAGRTLTLSQKAYAEVALNR
jgi:hypothetical protein